MRGHVLSNGIDSNGRMIGFVYAGDAAEPDGSTVFLDEAGVDRSLNAALLAGGHAYPAFYATLPADLRTHLAGASRAARTAASGLWPRSTADPDGPATVAGLAALEQLVLWPKLFRRIVPYLAAGFTDFDGFDAWLRADPVDRDDELFLLDRGERGNLHDVVIGLGQTIQLTAWPEDFIISPDPQTGGGQPPAPHTLGSVLVIAALPDPAGSDAGAETITLLNISAATVDLAGWTVSRRHRGPPGPQRLPAVRSHPAHPARERGVARQRGRHDPAPRRDRPGHRPGRLPAQPGASRPHHRVRTLTTGVATRPAGGRSRRPATRDTGSSGARSPSAPHWPLPGRARAAAGPRR